MISNAETMPRDTIFAGAGAAEETAFRFDGQVTAVFDDMLERSVPGYSEVQRQMVMLAREFVQAHTMAYDLGCSLGTTSFALAAAGLPEGAGIIGVDNSAPMVEEARARLESLTQEQRNRVRFDMAAVDEHYVLPNASVVILSLVMQFLRPIERAGLLKSIHNQLHEGGAVILYEKVMGETPGLDRMFTTRYYQFKESNGYSSLEISRKRTALENVLVPFKVSENMRLLMEAGFQDVCTFYQWYNFAGFLGIKR